MFSRRRFLRTSALYAAGISAGSLTRTAQAASANEKYIAVGRVTVNGIYVYQQTSFQSERLRQFYRDDLLPLLEEITAQNGPKHNPIWYRIAEGFIHSGYVQRIPYLPLNDPLTAVNPDGMLMQVTVPYTRAFYAPKGRGLQPLYRLYYDSIHWVHAVIEGTNGAIWYKIKDAKNDSEYFVSAADFRPVHHSEYQPTAQNIAPEKKRIHISIENQTLTAFEGEKVVLQTLISSGLPSPEGLPPDEIPTDTPKGYFRITLKMPSRHMGDGRLTSQIDAYELPGVAWAMAFHETGVALHGTYWHNHFGRKMSHGCVNMRNEEALWLFRWTDPPYTGSDWYLKGLGTLIQIE